MLFKVHTTVVCLSLLYLVTGLAAQQMPLRQYDLTSGLPSTEVHDIHQDRLGYLWFATDHGVARFDGHVFEVFTTQNGLTDNTVFNIHEDPTGRLWFGTYLGGICYLEEDTIMPHPFNDTLRQLMGRQFINHFVVHPDDQIEFSLQFSNTINAAQYRIDANGRSSTSPNLLVPYLDFNESTQVEISDWSDFCRRIENNDFFFKYGRDFLQSRTGATYFNTRNKLYRISPEGSHATIVLDHQPIIRLYEDNVNALWIGINNGGGLYRIQQDGQNHITEKVLTDLTVTDIIQDKELNYWISTTEEGVFMIPNTAVSVYRNHPTLSEKMLALTVWQQHLWIGTHSGKIIRLDDRENPTLVVNPESGSPIYQLKANDHYLFSNRLNVIDVAGARHDMAINSSIKAIQPLQNSRFWGGGIRGLIPLAIDVDYTEIGPTPNTPAYIYALLQEPDADLLWVGTNQGLYHYQAGRFTALSQNPLWGTRVTDIKKFGTDRYAFATKGDGLYLYNGTSYRRLGLAEGLNNHFVKSIFVQNDTTLWVGSSEGINCIRLSADDGWTIVGISSIDAEDGLPSNEVFDLAWYANKLWAATSNGLCHIRPHQLTEPPAPTLHLNNVSVNFIPQDGEDHYALAPDENNVTIDYVGLHYRARKGVLYKYRLLGYDTTWRTTRQQSVTFTNLPYGEYEFQLASATPTGRWNEQPLTVNWHIAQYYYKQWWFVLLLVVAGGILLASGFYHWQQRQRRQVNIERRILQSEQKALRAQINPHFVFNAMNSIQYFVTENDRHNAGIYLSRFSKLIRRILENSKKNWISLEEEIEGLQHYLELEKLRFSDKFNYTILIDPGIPKTEVEIPAMMLQPFVENAIWHGFSKKSEMGQLVLRFDLIDGQLRCQIDDNGIGREAAAELRGKRGHPATGIANIRERIDLLNQQYGLRMRIHIEDKIATTGTRVTLWFPLSPD